MASKRNVILRTLVILTIALFSACAIFIFAGANGKKANAAGETVEVMNDHFTVNVSGYRTDYVSDQQIQLKYDKAFTDSTMVWLANGATGLAATDFGDYLVINGRTYNEIKKENQEKKIYSSVDKQYGHMDWGGVWSPVSVSVASDTIGISVNRGYLDIGAMTVGIKDGFSYEYNGTTFKTEGDMMFKATITADNVATPVFKRVEEISETSVQYVNNRNVEGDAAHAVYTGFRTFPLNGAGNALNTGKYVSGRSLADNYMYMKEYIKINGKSMNYWNVVKFDNTLDYTNNPVNNAQKQYSLPIIAVILNNGEFKIWIHTEWAEKVGIDFNNFVIEFAEGMPYVGADGTVCRTSGTYVATRASGAWSVKVVKEEVMNNHFTVAIATNGYRGDFVTDQGIALTYDKAFTDTAELWLGNGTTGLAATDFGDYLVINGKTYNEIKRENQKNNIYSSADKRLGHMDWGGVWSPVSVQITSGTTITIYVNRAFADIGAMTVGIKDGFSYEYNGTTFKTEGDMMFKATITADNVATPVFKKVEEISETSVQYVNNRNVEGDAAHAAYTGFRTFPLYVDRGVNVFSTGKYSSGRSLADNYMYMKEYIKINGKSMNYWNVVKFDDTLDYTNNPVNNAQKQYSLPIIAVIQTDGEFKIWIHTEWAEKVGIDFDNFEIEFAEGMPYVDADGNVCRTTGNYEAVRTNGVWSVNKQLTASGAEVRLYKKVEGQKDRSAIRFVFETANVYFEGFLNADGTYKAGVSSGVLLIPKNLLGSATLDLANDSDMIERVTLAAADWAINGNVRTAKVALYNFPASQYQRDICARAYITDGEKTVYSEVLTRNMEQVAKAYLLDGGVTDEELKTLAEQYIVSATVMDLSDYVEAGFVEVTAGSIVKDGAKYEEVKEDCTYVYSQSNKAWSHSSSALGLSDKEFITIADFPPRMRAEGFEERLQGYVDLGFTTILLTEDDYPILDKDAEGNYITGQLNEAYEIILKRLLASGLDVWVRNYNNQGDYFSSKELTTQFQKYGKVTGFYMSDEPFTKNTLANKYGQDGVAMDCYDGLITWKNEYYPNDFWHINLVPSDSYNHWEGGMDSKNSGYGEYIQYYIDNVLKKLTSGGRTVCLDCYPLRDVKTNGIYSCYLFDLMTAANKTRDYNKTVSADQKATFGMCVQTFAYYGGNVNTKQRNIDSAEEITFQLYTGMAMGAGMFEYFAYSSDYSEANGVGKGYDCITKLDGTKNDLYGYVKTANERAFDFAKFINAYEWQGATVSAGTTENENAQGFAMLDGLTLASGETGALTAVTSSHDAVVGYFKQGDKEGYMVTNYTDPKNSKTNVVELTLSGCTKAAVYINGKLVTVDVIGGKVKIELLKGNAAFVIPL